MDKTLVAYFSATGATKRLAEKLSKILKADIFEIEPEIKYTEEDLKWPDKNSRTCKEMKNKRFRPLVLHKVENLSQYNKVLLGFPIWYYTAPTIINTFLEENNLEGKKVYVFITSGATPVDKSLKDLQKAYPEINFVSGKRFNGGFHKEDVVKWVK